MAGLLRQFMNEFEELRKSAVREKRYYAAQAYFVGIELANNSPASSPREAIDGLRRHFTLNSTSDLLPEEISAYEDMRGILDIYEADLTANGQL